MINYSGDIAVSGSVSASNGSHAVFSGDVGVDLSLSYDPSGNGTGDETISGTLNATVYYSNGSTNKYTLPFGPLSGQVQVKEGAFTLTPETVTSVGGITVSMSGSGTIVDNLAQITETITARGSGSYNGVSFTETVNAVGTLNAAPPDQNTKAITGYLSAGYGTPLPIYGVIDVYGVSGAGVGGTGVSLTQPDALVVSSATVKNTGGGAAVTLADGGYLKNVSWGLASVSGLVSGSVGVDITGGVATIANHATIAGVGAGVEAAAGAAATIINYATIEASGGYGVVLGSAGDRLVVEYGSTIIGRILGGGATLEMHGGNSAGANHGVLTGFGGVGILTGSAYATFSGFGTYAVDGFLTLTGVESLAAGKTMTSIGVITADGSFFNSGVVAATATIAGINLGSQSFLENKLATATISGGVGVYGGLFSSGTFENFGVVRTLETYGVEFMTSGDRLIVEAGSQVIGLVKGGGGTLEVGGGAGTISGLGGWATAQGAVAMTFSDFQSILIDAGATWSLSGVNNLQSMTLTNRGALTIGGAVSGAGGVLSAVAGTCTLAPGARLTGISVQLSGGQIAVAGSAICAGAWTQTGGALSIASGATLSLSGADSLAGSIIGAGTLAITAGIADFYGPSQFTLAAVHVTGAGTNVQAFASMSFTGDWTQAAGNVWVAQSTTFTFKGAADVFSATHFIGGGAIAFFGGAHAMTSVTLNLGPVTITNAAVTLKGNIVNETTIQATTGSLQVAGALALSGRGSLILSDRASNSFSASGGPATLTNVDNTIAGSGLIGAGGLKLVNDRAGIIDGDQTIALTLDTGAIAIANAGLIEAAGAGAVVVRSALANTGVIEAQGGVMTLYGPVTGAGHALVDGGTFAAQGAFAEAVTFGASGGALVLAQSQSYTGRISGFSTAGATSLDLRDIRFVNAGEASFSGTGAGGVLTVTDGTHTARINLTGAYTAATFTAASDGHGGVAIVASPAPAPHVFAAAIAALASPAAPHLYPGPTPLARPTPLAAPHG